jgi:hypothetical protein
MPKPRMKLLQLKYTFGDTFSRQFSQSTIYPRFYLLFNQHEFRQTIDLGAREEGPGSAFRRMVDWFSTYYY